MAVSQVYTQTVDHHCQQLQNPPFLPAYVICEQLLVSVFCSKYVGTFQLHVDESGDAIANNDAAIFISTNPKPKLYVYR